MSAQKDKMWSASLDGELSAAETAEFEHALTPAQKSALAAEMELERALAQRLSRGAACPDELWKRTLAAVEQQAVSGRSTKALPRWAYAITAVAAVFLITIAGAAFRAYQMREPSILAMAPSESVAQLTQEAELRGASTEDINAYLKEHGFGFAMTTTEVQVPGAHHTREMLGVHPVTYRGEQVMEVLFDCCGKPIKIVVAKAGGRAAAEIGDAVAAGQVQASKPVGGYVAAVVGHHKASGLLEYLTEASA